MIDDESKIFPEVTQFFKALNVHMPTYFERQMEADEIPSFYAGAFKLFGLIFVSLTLTICILMMFVFTKGEAGGLLVYAGMVTCSMTCAFYALGFMLQRDVLKWRKALATDWVSKTLNSEFTLLEMNPKMQLAYLDNKNALQRHLQQKAKDLARKKSLRYFPSDMRTEIEETKDIRDLLVLVYGYKQSTQRKKA